MGKGVGEKVTELSMVYVLRCSLYLMYVVRAYVHIPDS